MQLIVVESPTTARTLESILGSRYKVLPTMGHLRELCINNQKKGFLESDGVKYQIIPGKMRVIKSIHAAARLAERVFIATDSDRDGETIASHLFQSLKRTHKSLYRVLLTELTPTEVCKALAEPFPLHMGKVNAHKARAFADLHFSRFVANGLRKRFPDSLTLSSGRVLGTALRLIYEGQRSKKLAPSRFILRAAIVDSAGRSRYAESTTSYSTEREARAALSAASRDKTSLNGSETAEIDQIPPKPYTTATLLQDVLSKHARKPSEVLITLQHLFEGNPSRGRTISGLISYPRTSSDMLPPGSRSAVRRFISEHYGENYLGTEVSGCPRGSHGCIRPVDVFSRHDELQGILAADHWLLYKNLWDRTISSQMANARLRENRMTFSTSLAGLDLSLVSHEYSFDGFFRVAGYPTNNTQMDLEPIPNTWSAHSGSTAFSLTNWHWMEEVQTESAYTLSDFMGDLARTRVGHPGTFVSILENLIDSGLVEVEEKRMVVTPFGEEVNTHFSSTYPELFSVGFQQQFEADLDLVESGSKTIFQVTKELGVLLQSQRQFTVSETITPTARRSLPETRSDGMAVRRTHAAATHVCPRCGLTLVRRSGRSGPFLGCRGYPACTYSRKITSGLI